MYVRERGQALPGDVEWDHVPVDPANMEALLSSLGASEVYVRRQTPRPAWHLLDSASLADVTEGCELKVVRSGEYC